MKKVLLALAALCLAASLCGCGYSEEDLSNARSEGYKDGYSEGRSSGYEKGYDDAYNEWSWEVAYHYHEFNCPNPRCRADLIYETGYGVGLVAMPWEEDYWDHDREEEIGFSAYYREKYGTDPNPAGENSGFPPLG